MDLGGVPQNLQTNHRTFHEVPRKARHCRSWKDSVDCKSHQSSFFKGWPLDPSTPCLWIEAWRKADAWDVGMSGLKCCTMMSSMLYIECFPVKNLSQHEPTLGAKSGLDWKKQQTLPTSSNPGPTQVQPSKPRLFHAVFTRNGSANDGCLGAFGQWPQQWGGRWSQKKAPGLCQLTIKYPLVN